MRSIIYVESQTCPRCRYIKRLCIDPVLEEMPDRVQVIDGSMDTAFRRKHNVKAAPTIMYMEDGKETGRTVSKHLTAAEIMAWIKKGETKEK